MIPFEITPVKFICKKDLWRQYRGYVFERGKTTTVTDRATIEELMRHRDFEIVAQPVVAQSVTQNAPVRETLTLPNRRGRPRKSEAVL